MDNQDKTTFSLDDEEIVEEEVIDRDEEYEDDEDYDDYDDEEYDDEGYDDEDYGDEDYAEDDYDDGYNDDYYDDRLNKVLDELAELKRGMVPAAPAAPAAPSAILPPQPIMPPQYIYQPTAPPAGSEVVMYNEISRLRDELARNQSSLEMQKELTRIKEDMQRDQKFAEAQYNAEIQRLQSKIDDLLKNGSSPQGELPADDEPARIEGGNSNLELDKLLSINEAILRAMRETDARVQSEIGQLKKQLEELPSVKELNGAVSAVKKAANNMDNGGLAKLSSTVAELKELLENGVPASSGSGVSPQIVSAESGLDVNASELLRQLYDIKTVIGNTSEEAVKRAQTISELVCEYKKVTYDVHSQSTSYKDKLNSVYSYVKRLTDTNEPDAIDLVEATNSLIEELGAQPLNKQSFAAVAEFCNERGMTTVTSAMRDSAERFFGLVKKISEAAVESYGDYLPDLVAEINTLQNKKHEAENAAAVGEITTALLDEDGDKNEVKEKVEQLMAITVGDVLDLPVIDMPKSYKPATVENTESLFTKLEEIKTALAEWQTAAPVAAEEGYSEPEAVSDVESEGAPVDGADLQQVLYSIEELKNKLETATAADGMAEALEELRNNYLDISNRIVDISEKLQEPITVETSGGVEMSDEERQVALDDLGYIRAKLDDYETFFNSISELRTEIATMGVGASIGENTEMSEQLADQVSSLMSEITTQLDKLYEDVTNVIIESESNIIGKLGDGSGAAEAIEAAKAEILADTQAIKDSLLTVSDTILVSSPAEAIEQLRADITSLIDMTASNTDAATADRQRLLDDIAFLREQAELAISEGEQIPDGAEAVQDTDKLVGYLDEIAARVSLIGTVAEDTAVTKDTVTTLSDTLTTVNDNVATVTDTLAAVTDSVAAVSDSISAINDNFVAVNDNFAVINDNVNAARDSANAALEALSPITEQLNSILERLDAPISEEVTEEVTENVTGDELAEVRENLNTVLDTLTLMPQAEDVVAARDNTLAIIDTLTLMPHVEDVTAVRDNVAAVLEAVNTLTESLSAEQNQAVLDELGLLRETLDVANENINLIREKVEATEPADTETLLQDLQLVLEKIEQYELSAANNKQEIIDTVNGIREEIHINTLDENMSASGMDGETRDALLGEIAEIRERLGNIESSTQAINDVNVAAIDGLTAQIADLQAILESQMTEGEQGEEAPQSEIDSDNMQALVSELSYIREKLDAAPEYDTVEEILSLREDIKAARIVDQDEVSGELESIKNELAAISSGNILDEIRALREDIANLPAGDGNSAATDGEINLVLNEIVSLRDEVFAFKDEVLNATGTVVEQEAEPAEAEESPEDVVMLLDEITALRADQSALTDSIDELKDLVSRRTTISTADGDETGETVEGASSDELNIVLDEIINLKNDIDRIEEMVGGERLNAIAEQVEEIRAVLDELRGGEPAEALQSEAAAQTVDLTPVMDQLELVNAALDDIRLGQEAVVAEEGGSTTGSLAERFDELHSEIEEIKTAVAGMAPVDYADELAQMRAEIEALRAENEQLKAEGSDSISAQIADLKETIRDMMVATPVATEGGDTSYAALIDEIRDLKAQLAETAPVQTAATLDEQALQDIRDMLAAQTEQHSYAGELSEIRDEIAQLRSLTTVTAESSGSAEVAALRDELAEIKAMLSSSDSMMGVAEDVTAIKADVQSLKEEPDLGVMSEILALRDEFQTLREQIEDVKRIASETDSESDDSLMTEIQSLRDQLFAISMANVNDPMSGESNYESYNNIILDEIASIRDQIATAGSASDIEAVSDEFTQLKEAIDKREAMYETLAERVAKLNNDATNNRILEELASLRTDMANQRDADLTTLNFMSEMAHLLERQNQYLTQNAGTKISDEIESLKAEIASSDAVAEEVAKLREVMVQSGSASDNDTILAELADLREELSREKPSQENALILDAIARLRDEITILAEREKVRDFESDAGLSDSLSDLKEQLNEIAGIIEPAQPVQPAQPKPEKKPAASSTAKKRGRKPGQKNAAKTGGTSSTKSTSTGKKRTTTKKPAQKPATKKEPEQTVTPVVEVPEQPVPPVVQPEHSDFESIIEQQAGLLGGDNEMSLNPKAQTTADAMDVADRLAKQVANKLIMEQLVEQLGDGGVSEDRVDEILRDILPQEFTTIAETEASDKVRRLANQLVLNKLRSRLNGNRSDDDE